MPNEDGALVVASFSADNKQNEEVAAKIEAAINYIIKTNEDDQLSLVGVTKIAGWDTAHEGDTVTVMANEKIKRVTNNGTALLQNEDGNFYLVVPRGGGVYLMASSSELPPAVDDAIHAMALFTSETYEGPNGEKVIFLVFEGGSFVLTVDGNAALCGKLLARDGGLVLRAYTGAEFAVENGSVTVEAKGSSYTLNFNEESVAELMTLALKG